MSMLANRVYNNTKEGERSAVNRISTMVVDIQPILRKGIRSILEEQDDMDVVGEAGDVPQAMASVESLTPDVVLLDISLAGGDSLDTARQIKRISPHTAVIMLTSQEDEEQLFQSIKVGAAAYYHKN